MAAKKIKVLLENKKFVSELVTKAIDYALMSGLIIRTEEHAEKSLTVEHAPFLLFPSEFPAALLQQALDIQTTYNQLYHSVAMDLSFLEQCLRYSIETDEFICRLWEIHSLVEKEGRAQPLRLCLSRSDYMADASSSGPQLKQVEFNCIASSMAGVISRVDRLHRFTLGEADVSYSDEELPQTTCLEDLAAGLVDAWKAYDKSHAQVLFVVHSGERNTFDQRWLEHTMSRISRSEGSPVRVMYRTLEVLHQTAGLSAEKELLVDGEEIALVYYRAAYDPSTCDSDEAWAARLMLERSKAIQCPSVSYQLAGCKKVQQELCRPGVLERFVSDGSRCKQLRDTFAAQYGFDEAEADAALKMARSRPQDFVLKPQREGGGHNTYGEDILPLLESSASLGGYVLMQRLHPLQSLNVQVRAGQAYRIRTVSELGVYGVCLGDQNAIIINRTASHMMRTKGSDVNEGGIGAGAAALDTPLLV